MTGQPVPKPVDVTPEHVRTARYLLMSGSRSLGEVAGRLGVPTGALDLALWRHLGERG